MALGKKLQSIESLVYDKVCIIDQITDNYKGLIFRSDEGLFKQQSQIDVLSKNDSLIETRLLKLETFCKSLEI